MLKITFHKMTSGGLRTAAAAAALQTPFHSIYFFDFWLLGDALYAEHQSSQEQMFYGPKVYFK